MLIKLGLLIKQDAITTIFGIVVILNLHIPRCFCNNFLVAFRIWPFFTSKLVRSFQFSDLITLPYLCLWTFANIIH